MRMKIHRVYFFLYKKETYWDSSLKSARNFFPFSNRFWRRSRRFWFLRFWSLTFFKIREIFRFWGRSRSSRGCKKPRALRQPVEIFKRDPDRVQIDRDRIQGKIIFQKVFRNSVSFLVDFFKKCVWFSTTRPCLT